MFRNINRISSSSLKNFLIKHKINSNTRDLIKNESTNIPIQAKKRKTMGPGRYYSAYFFNLVNAKFSNNITYDGLKDDMFFENNLKETLKLLNKENNDQEIDIVDKLSILRSLQLLDVPAQDSLICKLIEDLSPNLNQLNVEKSLKVLLAQVQFQNSSLQKMFIQNLVKFIEDNFDSNSDWDLILMIYNEKITNYFSNEFLLKVDNYALELSKRVNENALFEQEITWILHKLSLTKRRPKPLIHYLTNLLNEIDLKNLEFNIVISLIDSLANLSYLPLDLMTKAIDYLIEIDFKTRINKYDFNLLLKSLIKLRYDPVDLFDYLAIDFDFVNEKLGKKCMMNLIATMAFFNYSKDVATKLIDHKIFQKIDIDLIKDNKLRIEYLWSLAFYDCLNEVPTDQFTLDFHTKFLDKKYFYYLKPRFCLLYHYCKLNLGLDVKLPDKYLYIDYQPKEKNLPKTDDLLSFLKLENFLTNVRTDLGFKFDLVFVSNKNFETLPIKNLDEAKKLCNDDHNYKLIYAYFLNFKEFALNTSKIIGEVEMMKNIGKQLDYRIVLVNPHDILNKPPQQSFNEFKQSVIDLI